MAKYVLMYSGGGMPETEEEQAKVMAAWGAWYEKLGSAVSDPGDPFSGNALKIGSDGAVSDATKSTSASGYTVLEADSMESAVKMAKGCPILTDGGQIMVHETMPVM